MVLLYSMHSTYPLPLLDVAVIEPPQPVLVEG